MRVMLAEAPLDHRRQELDLMLGAPTWPPNPQRSAAPWRSQGAPRSPTTGTGSHVGGPDMAPKPPTLGSAPAEPWRSSITDDRNSTARCSPQGRGRQGGPSHN